MLQMQNRRKLTPEGIHQLSYTLGHCSQLLRLVTFKDKHKDIWKKSVDDLLTPTNAFNNDFAPRLLKTPAVQQRLVALSTEQRVDAEEEQQDAVALAEVANRMTARSSRGCGRASSLAALATSVADTNVVPADVSAAPVSANNSSYTGLQPTATDWSTVGRGKPKVVVGSSAAGSLYHLRDDGLARGVELWRGRALPAADDNGAESQDQPAHKRMKAKPADDSGANSHDEPAHANDGNDCIEAL